MRNLNIEIPRKIFHIIGTLFFLIPLYFFGNWAVTILCFFLLVLLIPIAYFKKINKLTGWFWFLIKNLEREENLNTLPGKQAFVLVLGILISSIVFSKEILQVCIITTAVYDGFATIIGMTAGKNKLPTGKTIEGTIGGIIINFICLIPILGVYNSLLVSVFASVVENLSSLDKWYLDDNFLLPIFTGLILTILQIPAKFPQFFQSI